MSAFAVDGEHPFDNFPYTTQGRVIENEDEMWELMISYGGEVGAYSLLQASPRRLFDSWANQILSRFVYCRDMNTPAYPGSYEEHPAYWIDAVDLIKAEISKVQEFKANQEKVKRGN